MKMIKITRRTIMIPVDNVVDNDGNGNSDDSDGIKTTVWKPKFNSN